MDPTSIQLFALDNGRWSWEVGFAEASLNRDGYATTYAEAFSCVLATIDNGRVIAGPNDTGIDIWSRGYAAALPPEGAVE